jgi:hypothetical protein
MQKSVVRGTDEASFDDPPLRAADAVAKTLLFTL